MYSKTLLTKEKDKLIALASIAKMVSRRIFNQTDENYIAGMWRTYLESQLLWRVDPAIENGRYSFHSFRPQDYRAPTFPWAAVDTERGIKYADATDYGVAKGKDLFFEVETVQPKRGTSNYFGMVTGGHLILKGVLKNIEIVDSGRTGYTRYHWQLVRDGETLKEEFKLIYLDAPCCDCPGIVGPEGRVHCLPAVLDPSTSPQELICLLLQSVDEDNIKTTATFRRVGLTKISRYHPKHQEYVQKLSKSGEEAKMPCPWDAKTGKHIIRII